MLVNSFNEIWNVALSTKIILVGMCLVPMFFMGLYTYLNRIDAGDSVSDAFDAAFAVFIILFLTGIFMFTFVFAIAELSSHKKQE